MLDLIDPDPVLALSKVVFAVVGVVVCVALWFRLSYRVRRYGGGTLATVVVGAGLVGLLVSLYPGLIPSEVAFVVLITALIVIYRPEQVVKSTGGPRIEWRALREGRELQQLVARRTNPSLAKRNPEIKDRFEALGSLEAPSTAEYLGLLRETLFADPRAPDAEANQARLAKADAALRDRLGAPPIWEHEQVAHEDDETPAKAE